MKTSKPAVAIQRDKERCRAPPSGCVMYDTLSLPSYKEYPVRPPSTNTQTPRRASPSKAFPESSSGAILSALRNLHEKMIRLDEERLRAERSLLSLGKEKGAEPTQGDALALRHAADAGNHTDARARTHTERAAGRETSDQEMTMCNQALVTQLAAAESRCAQLERQLGHMRRMVRSAKADRTSLLKQQALVETSRSVSQSHDSASERAQLDKLDRLEREYLRLTCTQTHAERKIQELEIKLQEEERQRKLVQDKADRLQTGMEANRILLQAAASRPPRGRTKEKRPASKKPPEPLSHTEPHYRLSLGDVPFVAGTSVGCSHSVRANVQSVLSLLKQHQPQLCNARVLSQAQPTNHGVLSQAPAARPANYSGSDRDSASSSGGEDLSELLAALQDELRHMSLEQQALMQQADEDVSEQRRRRLNAEQENLLLRMERKGQQISHLLQHQTQVRRLRREMCDQKRALGGGVGATVSVTQQRGRSAVTARPGERSRSSLRLLRDMRALQTSLRT